ncbi:MAG: radical SAM protein [Planctomycetota bacterium]|jgi:radical SAM superfamily enzyme YgiQ (UPF0313 family)
MNSLEYKLTGHVIRPPAEAESVILQLMEGCPHNKCTFCGTYRDTDFRVKSDQEFEQHTASALSAYSQTSKRVFLSDGDVISLPLEKIIKSIKTAGKHFTRASRFSMYARSEGILKLNEADLKSLKNMGLSTLYLGLESGSEKVLQDINKGETAEEMTTAVIKAQQVGLKCSVMALIGIAGSSGSEDHAVKTAEVLTRMNPRFINLLTFMPVKGTELYQSIAEGRFTLLDDRESLHETRLILNGLHKTRSIFRADHASNPLSLSGRLPRDLTRISTEIDQAIAGNAGVTPAILRGL